MRKSPCEILRDNEPPPNGHILNVYDAELVPIFDGDKLSIYDAHTTKFTVLRKAILEGWYVPREGLWRTPLVDEVNNSRLNEETLAMQKSPCEILRDNEPPPNGHILNVYELKNKPKVIQYYHAAAGFPTESTWIAAIKNGHYASWKGLTVMLPPTTTFVDLRPEGTFRPWPRHVSLDSG